MFVMKATPGIQIDVKRIIALWGFSEAAFGGILHALRIPLTGMFIGAAAVLFITLIAHYSTSKKSILHATVTVIIIKALISPHTPLAAYFAVALQGILGYLLFSFIRIERIAALLLGFFALLFSALQKFVILTILFGNTLWEAIDEFVNYILLQVNIQIFDVTAGFSFFLIGFYSLIHVIAGIYVGWKAPKIPEKLNETRNHILSQNYKNHLAEDLFDKDTNREKKIVRKRISRIIFILFLLIIMILSYLTPGFEDNRGFEILIMILRSIIITFIWFSVLSPYVVKWFNRFIERNKYERASEINIVTGLFPEFKKIINYAWKSSSGKGSIRRFRIFLSESLFLLLATDINPNE